MAVRRKKTTKKAAPKRRKAVSLSDTKAVAANKKAHWAAYRKLQKQVNDAWAVLRKNIEKKAAPHILVRDKNRLLLLLGECNYMTRQCVKASRKE